MRFLSQYFVKLIQETFAQKMLKKEKLRNKFWTWNQNRSTGKEIFRCVKN